MAKAMATALVHQPRALDELFDDDGELEKRQRWLEEQLEIRQRQLEKAFKNVTFTLTVGEQSEPHVGMKMHGEGLAASGFTIEDLLGAQRKWELAGCATEFTRLDELLDDGDAKGASPAAILVVKSGVNHILKAVARTATDLFLEQTSFVWDTTFWDTRRKKVLNKRARYNVCYGKQHVDADIPNRQGTVMSYEELPNTAAYRSGLEQYFGAKAAELEMEGNNYFDATCGIGAHGDSERRKVIGCRLGTQIPLQFKWFVNSKSFGPIIEIRLAHGDIYIMSEKATGTDWKTRTRKTLRHCAGAKRYLFPAFEVREQKRALKRASAQ